MVELKNHKSALAALATLGVTAVAAGATAFVKLRERQRKRRQEAEQEAAKSRLTAEQMMVYNEAVSQFIHLNERIYALRRHRQELQPLIQRLALKSEAVAAPADEELATLAADIERFITAHVPFINACLATISGDDMKYADYLRAPVGGTFDPEIDEEPTGADVAKGSPIKFVLQLGYYFPESTLAPLPCKAIVLA